MTPTHLLDTGWIIRHLRGSGEYTAACDRFGRSRAGLRGQNLLIGDMDLFIGATCLENGLTLLTTNRRHFERLPDLRIVSDPASL